MPNSDSSTPSTTPNENVTRIVWQSRSRSPLPFAFATTTFEPIDMALKKLTTRLAITPHTVTAARAFWSTRSPATKASTLL